MPRIVPRTGRGPATERRLSANERCAHVVIGDDPVTLKHADRLMPSHAQAFEGIERTGWRRRLTVPMARRRVLQLARRMGHSPWTRRQLEGLGKEDA